jgi:hypothetical protein
MHFHLNDIPLLIETSSWRYVPYPKFANALRGGGPVTFVNQKMKGLLMKNVVNKMGYLSELFKIH